MEKIEGRGRQSITRSLPPVTRENAMLYVYIVRDQFVVEPFKVTHTLASITINNVLRQPAANPI